MFCGECGTRMEEIPEADEDTVICFCCGARNEKGKKFCGICGQRLEAAEAAVSEAAESVAATAEAEPEKAAPAEEAVKPERPKTIFCPNCGTQLPGDALFCGECGYRIEF